MINKFEKNYDSAHVLHENLVFKKGITLLKGSNGSGKSTLLKAISGLIVSNLEPYDAVYLPERPEFPPYLSGKKYLSCIQSLINDDAICIESLLEKFSLPTSKQCIKNYSKGMKQKLALCEMLLQKKNIYVLDEPFNGLDDNSLKVAIKAVEALDGIVIISLHETINFNVPTKEIVLCKD